MFNRVVASQSFSPLAAAPHLPTCSNSLGRFFCGPSPHLSLGPHARRISGQRFIWLALYLVSTIVSAGAIWSALYLVSTIVSAGSIWSALYLVSTIVSAGSIWSAHDLRLWPRGYVTEALYSSLEQELG